MRKAPGIWGLLQHHPASYSPQKVLPSVRGASGTAPYGKFGPGNCITFLKRLDKDLRWQLLRQTPIDGQVNAKR